jgi:PAS domain S-box-containing protein
VSLATNQRRPLERVLQSLKAIFRMRLTNEFLDALSVPAFAIDLRHVVVGWNHPCEALTGIAAGEVMGTSDHWKGFYDEQRPCLADLVLENLTADASRFYDRHEKAEFASDGHKAEGWFDDMNGKRRFLTFEARPIFSGGELVGALEILQDITRHREAEEQLQLSASVFENTSEGIMITDATNRIISANKALEALTGFSEHELLGQNPKIFTSDRHPGTFFRKMWEMLSELGHWQGEIWNRKKTGEEYLVRAYISAVKTGPATTNYIGLLSDITEISRAMEKMDHLAHYDFLTGLPNRSLLEDRLQQALVRANRNNSRFAVMFMDLDRFKNINDT